MTGTDLIQDNTFEIHVFWNGICVKFSVALFQLFLSVSLTNHDSRCQFLYHHHAIRYNVLTQCS